MRSTRPQHCCCPTRNSSPCTTRTISRCGFRRSLLVSIVSFRCSILPMSVFVVAAILAAFLLSVVYLLSELGLFLFVFVSVLLFVLSALELVRILLLVGSICTD